MGYSRNRHSYIKEAYYLLCLVLAVVIFIFTVWGSTGHIELKKAEAELKAQRARVEALKQSNSKMLESVEEMRSNPKAVEKYARSKNYVQPGEIIQQIPADSPTNLVEH